MKKLQTLCVAIFLLVSLNSLAQKLTINTLPKANDKFDKFDNNDGKSEPITKQFLHGNDLLIYVSKTLKVTKVERNVKGQAPQTLSISTQDIDGARVLSGKDKYVITKNKDYSDVAIDLTLTINNKPIPIQIITSGDAVSANVETSADKDKKTTDEALKCKLEKLSKYIYRFIPDSLFASLTSGNPCLALTCDTCPDNTNTVIYDFSNNTTRKMTVKVGEPMAFRIKNVNPYLYSVTISHEVENYNQDTNSLVDLLNADNALKTFANGEIQSTECPPLTLKDRLTKAIVDLQQELMRIDKKSLSPYADANCLRSIMKKIESNIDKTISDSFGTDKIFSIADFQRFVDKNPKEFSDDFKKTFNDTYDKINENNFSFTYKIPEVQDVDQTNFLFDITPKNKNLALPAVKGGKISVYSKGGFKVDVSSGLYGTMALKNDLYSLRLTDDNSVTPSVKVNKFIREETGNGEFGFSSFFHFYPRTGGFVNVSGIIGAGLNFAEKPKPRYFGGVGFLFGRNNRIGINVGQVFGNVNRLSDQYKDLTQLPEDEKDIKYKTKLVNGWFLSLTYNISFLSKKSKEQNVNIESTSEKSSEGAAKK